MGAGSATSVRSRHMVKPMPPSKPTMARWSLDMPAGIRHKPLLAASHVKPKIPSGLPRSSPAPMPKATAAEAAAVAAAPAVEAPNWTAVLARAKSGIITNAESGSSLEMARSDTDSSSPPAVRTFARVETHSAATTPATSALTPARSKHHHRPTPPAAKSFMSLTPLSPAAAIAPTMAAAAARKVGARPLAKQVASTRIAPRSSTVASVSKKADDEGGMRLRKKP
mmetsp:Transcript_12929/g.29763  ORF Transcript_12929/g.29763 Transcript_12929/m.29763 type:complete len:225 (-) Transcript_12929:736-1410(-)